MNELRADTISNSWTIISSDRQKRPNNFSLKKDHKSFTSCAFCEGNESHTPPENYAVRPNFSSANGPGWNIRVVPNKYPAVKIGSIVNKESGNEFFKAIPAVGNHEVIIDSPFHSIRWEHQSISHLSTILTVIQNRLSDQEKRNVDTFALVFKNEGEYAGASLEHPHMQCISLPVVPPVIERELLRARRYYHLKKRCIICDMIGFEKQNVSRMVCENPSYSVFCPYASRFAYELCIVPKTHNYSFLNTQPNDIINLADILVTVLNALNSILTHFHYNVIFKTVPLMLFEKTLLMHETGDAYHWHITIAPRISPLQGTDWGTGVYVNAQSPENSAKVLRKYIEKTTQ
ncbi:galactose-1-phosphate uridylyltransferase [bacterium]|nr:galactose-1-phosphate uridylyltransferase [bacterium]MCP5462328.1 galactose-1-phosphate uridylyltransferase [bacterium]